MGTEIASLYAKIGADVSEFESKIGGAHKTLSSFGTALGGLATGAAVAATAAIAAVGAVIGTGIAKAASFEQSFADIAATMGKTTEEIAPLKKLIMDLGLDPKLKVSTDEAAAAVSMLVKNGLTMTDVLNGAARSTVLLANATGADFGMAADIATDVMQQFNITAADMDTAVNGILGVTQASKFGIQGYKDAIAMAGGVASSVGVNFDDFNATLAATAFNFSGGSDAGTSFKTFLQRLVPSTNEATAEMERLGIITADGSNRFFDASGQMRSMTDIADILQDAFAGLSEEQKINTAATLFGTDASRTAFALAKVGGEEITKLKGAIGNTSAEDAAATRMNTLSGQWEIFMGVVEASIIQIGEAFLPAAKKIVEWATSAAEKYLPAVVAWFEEFGAWIVDMLPKIEAWAVKLAGWGAALMEWADTGSGAMGIVGKAAELMGSLVTNAFGMLVGWIRDNLPAWVAQLQEWGRAAGAWIVDVGWPLLFANLQKWDKGLRDWIIAQYPNWVANLKEWGTAAGAWITETGWPLLLENLGKFGANLWKWIQEQLPTLIAHLVEWAVQLGAWVIEGIAFLISNLATGVDKVSRWLRGTGQDGIKDGVFSWVGPMWQWVMTELWPKLEPALWNLSAAILKMLGSMGGLIFEAIMAIARGIVNTFIAGIKGVWEGFVKWWQDLWFVFVDIGKLLWDGIKGIPGYLMDGFKRAWNDMWEGFKQWWRDAWENLTEIAQLVFGIHSPSTVFYDIGVNLMQGMANGVKATVPLVTAVLTDMATQVTTVTAHMYDQINAATQEIALRASYTTIADAQRANVSSQIAREQQAYAEQVRAAEQAAERAAAANRAVEEQAARVQAATQVKTSAAATVAGNMSSYGSYLSLVGSGSLGAYARWDQENAVALLHQLSTKEGVMDYSKSSNITIENLNLGASGNDVADIIAAIQFLNSSYSYGY